MDTDFVLTNHGSVCILKPLNDEAKGWIAENVDQTDLHWWCGGIAVETRFANEIMDGIIDAGLTVTDGLNID